MSSSINLINCPHCDQLIEIEALNCRIFRCGMFKLTLQQIEPHMAKDQCKELFEKGLIYGCGQPFQIISMEQNELKAIKCDYI